MNKKAKKTCIIVGVIIFSVLLLLCIGIFTVKLISANRKAAELKSDLQYYGINLPEADFKITDSHFNTVLHESWWFYSVKFSDEVPADVFGAEGLTDGVTSDASFIINMFKGSGQLTNLSSYANCKSKMFYGKRGTEQPLCIIYDSAQDLYHFLIASY